MNGIIKYKVELSLTDVVGLNDTINFEIAYLTEKNYNPAIDPSEKIKNDARIARLTELKHRLIDTIVDAMIEEEGSE